MAHNHEASACSGCSGAHNHEHTHGGHTHETHSKKTDDEGFIHVSCGCDSCGGCDGGRKKEKNIVRDILVRVAIAVVLAALGVVAEHVMHNEYLSLALFVAAYAVIAYDIVIGAVRNIFQGHMFDELMLMTIASIGAFLIGEYVEAIGVMVFYQVGEMFQGLAVRRSERSIEQLMDLRVDTANLLADGEIRTVSPEEVHVGDVIVVRPGEQIPLDGVVKAGQSALDTSALTGESLPRDVVVGDSVLSGSINQSGLIEVTVTSEAGDSTVARILKMLKEASQHKAPAEKFITKFSKLYTPIVVLLAVCIAVLPPLVVGWHEFQTYLYRALIFLVVSCPCALVLSVPLGFLSGIGKASKNGILVKGGNYLEALNRVDTVVFDKTGTLTYGRFSVEQIVTAPGVDESELIDSAVWAELSSSHPIARAVAVLRPQADATRITSYEELAGHGGAAVVDGARSLAGNERLMKLNGIDVSADAPASQTIVHVAKDDRYLGYITVADQPKVDADYAIEELKSLGVRQVMMFTGDREPVAREVAMSLGLDSYKAELLPDQKLSELVALKETVESKGRIVFVGDGINDAPVLAAADVGVAMGGMGSDAAIAAADVVLMTDEPSRLPRAIKIARDTRSIVIQNIVFALTVKVLAMILGAFGLTTMWIAILADVGVALLAVLNSSRLLLQKK